jgi:hypothetical protein
MQPSPETSMSPRGKQQQFVHRRSSRARLTGDYKNLLDVFLVPSILHSFALLSTADCQYRPLTGCAIVVNHYVLNRFARSCRLRIWPGLHAGPRL